MAETAIEALLRAAREEGVDTRELRLRHGSEGYDLAIAGEEYERVTEDRVREILDEHSAHVTEWQFWSHRAPEAPDRRAFLRWVEGTEGRDSGAGPGQRSVGAHREALQDGLSREWGQLRVSVALADSGRVYEIRHVEDADAGRETLDVHEDPLAARRLRKRDERGRYRPLSTVPTLRRGWAFVDLSPHEAVRAVEAFYPATIANWHREREGRLDVTHWHEAVSRQTGIYGLVETWDRGEGHEHVEWVAEACCADSQCLKRREWEYDEDTALDVDESSADGRRAAGARDGTTPTGGAGVFPCREPCSLVIAAARKWTRLESEESRTYEFELTPSEKEQLEAILDAVADGRVDEIREADFGDGANRYRARFLRAKRVADGALCGVPTHPDGASGDTAPGESGDSEGADNPRNSEATGETNDAE